MKLATGCGVARAGRDGRAACVACLAVFPRRTGVTSDIKGCRAAIDAAGHPALLLVDGVSSIGALDFRMDEWRVDVAVTGSQKALSLPTGLAYVAVSKKVRGGREGQREGLGRSAQAVCLGGARSVTAHGRTLRLFLVLVPPISPFTHARWWCETSDTPGSWAPAR